MTDGLFVCSCGEAHADGIGPAREWREWRAEHQALGHRVAFDGHRAACSPPKGCRRCGKPPGSRFTFYCSAECSTDFMGNHYWSTARYIALGWTPDGHGYLTLLDAKPCAHADETCYGALEVNHIQPLDGVRIDWACTNHQDNLEPLCQSHHIRETKAQRRDGRIGGAEAAARLRANDAKTAERERRREKLASMNPPML